MARVIYGKILPDGELFSQMFDDGDTVKVGKLLANGFLPVEIVKEVDLETQKLTGEKIIDVQADKIVVTSVVEDLDNNELKEKDKAKLASTDAGFIRVLEDLIDTLIAKGVITMNDLPKEAQDKIEERKTLRDKIK